jgi:hypothetical protein
VSANFSPSSGHSLSISSSPALPTTKGALCFQQLTNCSLGKPFCFTFIRVAPGCTLSAFRSKPSTVNPPLTPLFSALPYVFALTPLPTAFTHFHPGGRGPFPFWNGPFSRCLVAGVSWRRERLRSGRRAAFTFDCGVGFTAQALRSSGQARVPELAPHGSRGHEPRITGHQSPVTCGGLEDGYEYDTAQSPITASQPLGCWGCGAVP